MGEFNIYNVSSGRYAFYDPRANTSPSPRLNVSVIVHFQCRQLLRHLKSKRTTDCEDNSSDYLVKKH
jgi:hypothetical protein